jgi:hypothetical protein
MDNDGEMAFDEQPLNTVNEFLPLHGFRERFGKQSHAPMQNPVFAPWGNPHVDEQQIDRGFLGAQDGPGMILPRSVRADACEGVRG